MAEIDFASLMAMDDPTFAILTPYQEERRKPTIVNGGDRATFIAAATGKFRGDRVRARKLASFAYWGDELDALYEERHAARHAARKR